MVDAENVTDYAQKLRQEFPREIVSESLHGRMELDTKNKRLEIMTQSNDGFFLASEDMRLRRPGDMFGLRQSGLLEFAIGDVFNDADILFRVAAAVDRILKENPKLHSEENREYRRRTDELLEKRLRRLSL